MRAALRVRVPSRYVVLEVAHGSMREAADAWHRGVSLFACLDYCPAPSHMRTSRKPPSRSRHAPDPLQPHPPVHDSAAVAQPPGRLRQCVAGGTSVQTHLYTYICVCVCVCVFRGGACVCMRW